MRYSNIRKKIITMLVLMLNIILLTGCHKHEYSSATCTEPETCSCGLTRGSALGHKWSEATCTEAKKCSVCGEIEGEPLGHTTNLGVCNRCGEKVMSEESTAFYKEVYAVLNNQIDYSVINGNTVGTMYSGCMLVFNDIKKTTGDLDKICKKYENVEEVADARAIIKKMISSIPPKPYESIDGINNFLDGAATYSDLEGDLLSLMGNKIPE